MYRSQRLRGFSLFDNCRDISFRRPLRDCPDIDAGLHLTLTSEWKDYRWPPLSGRPAVPGLVDTEGALWRSVEQVAKNASPDEVETEIREQVRRAREMGFEPTHLDSHMGTLFATPEFIERYEQAGKPVRVEEGSKLVVDSKVIPQRQ